MVFENLGIPSWLVWILIISGIILVIWIWYKLPEGLKFNLRRLFSGKVMIVLIIVVGWWYWYSRDIIITENQSMFWMPLIISMIIIFITGLGLLKYISKQFTTPNFHGCFTDPIFVSGFVLLNIGSLNIIGNPTPADKVVIVREETFRLFERSAFSLARVAPVNIHAIDPDVKNEIDKRKLLFSKAVSRGEIYFGWFDDINQLDYPEEELDRLLNLDIKQFAFELQEQLTETKKMYEVLKKELNIQNPSLKELLRIYKNTNKAYNRQGEILESVIDDTEEGIEHFRRRKRAYEDKREPVEKSEGFEG